MGLAEGGRPGSTGVPSPTGQAVQVRALPLSKLLHPAVFWCCGGCVGVRAAGLAPTAILHARQQSRSAAGTVPLTL